MNFEKAMKELVSGKKIRRKEWDKLKYLHIRQDGQVLAFQGEYTHFYNNASVLISTGWKVVDSNGSSMTFVEAIEELRNKKCITRDDMGESFLFIDNESITLCRPVEFDFMPTWKCINSNDWEVVK